MTSNTETIWVERQKALSRLAGARLTSVQFVMNYLILGFDQKGALTCLVWPEILVENTRVIFGTPGYRDTLCSLIETVVDNITMMRDETICIVFENGTEMRIPLRSYQGCGERAILTAPKHYLLVF